MSVNAVWILAFFYTNFEHQISVDKNVKCQGQMSALKNVTNVKLFYYNYLIIINIHLLKVIQSFRNEMSKKMLKINFFFS